MKNNEWLEDPEFIYRLDYYDKYYITSLCKRISIFLKTLPITVITTWDNNHKSLYITVGTNKNYFSISPNIAYEDYLTLIQRWLIQFFPTYDVTEKIKRKMTPVELTVRRDLAISNNEKIDFNSLLDLEIDASKKEYGIITKVYVFEENDKFEIEINDKKYLYMSGTLNRPMGLSTFLKKLRKIENNVDRKNFIFNNSHMIEPIVENSKDKFIEYNSQQIFNFFVINYLDLKKYEPIFVMEKSYKYINADEELIEQKQHIYRWGQYMIKFPADNEELINDCISFYKDAKEKDLKVINNHIVY